MQSFNEWSQLFEEGKKKKEWKTGKKLGIKGTVKAALDHHPEKFSKDGKNGKLNPYAIFTAMKKKGKMTPHYKNQPSTLKGKPKKKSKFKEWLEIREEKEYGWKQINDDKERKYGKIRNMSKKLKNISKEEQKEMIKNR
jgi:hypothetical protein